MNILLQQQKVSTSFIYLFKHQCDTSMFNRVWRTDTDRCCTRFCSKHIRTCVALPAVASSEHHMKREALTLLSFLVLSSSFPLLLSLSELSYITFVDRGGRRGRGLRPTTKPLRTWKQPPHLVLVIGTQIFETSFFVFQTIDCLIYELALEFHRRNATDEKITLSEIFVQRERMNWSSRPAPGSSLQSRRVAPD